MGMWMVEENGLEPVQCALLSDARQYVEDRAVEIWETLRDPNDPSPQPFEGVAWSVEISEGARPASSCVSLAPFLLMIATYRSTEWRVRYDH